ncbi:hypothetical protein [Corynebacterium freiburgense]|uniref:hypothetical protein n=1 Tax=Corynebacterium freiburgense TaxID=556548 RepID=UPI0004152E0A|nr:hypothetical protein [Corynebacterium freiburgense]WJZ01958.1 hypothetical protein CFREI_03275 [Corynebacterium freiburgense]
MELKSLVTMLILPKDEAWILKELSAHFGSDIQPQFHDGDAEPYLFEQWALEHPDTPVGERRIRTLSARVNDSDVKRVAEVVIDIISPHAREEDRKIRNGEQVTMTPDRIPWSAYTALWEDEVR